MIKVRARNEDYVQFAALLLNGQEFNTHGHLWGRREFQGLGDYVPKSDAEVTELHRATFLVYSYNTPILWRTDKGAWVFNWNEYGATTTRHQAKIFAAVTQL